MSDAVKKVPRKLRSREVIMVDEQILAWRKMMRREGIKLGRGARYRDKVNKAWREEHAEVMAKRDDIRKKRFF